MYIVSGRNDTEGSSEGLSDVSAANVSASGAAQTGGLSALLRHLPVTGSSNTSSATSQGGVWYSQQQSLGGVSVGSSQPRARHGSDETERNGGNVLLTPASLVPRNNTGSCSGSISPVSNAPGNHGTNSSMYQQYSSMGGRNEAGPNISSLGASNLQPSNIVNPAPVQTQQHSPVHLSNNTTANFDQQSTGSSASCNWNQNQMSRPTSLPSGVRMNVPPMTSSASSLHLSRPDAESASSNAVQFHYREQSAGLHTQSSTPNADSSAGGGLTDAARRQSQGATVSSATEPLANQLPGLSEGEECQEVVVALGLVDSLLPSGSWQLDLEDIRQLMNCFDTCEWVKLLHSSAVQGQTLDCCIAQFSDPRVGYTVEKQLKGVVIPGVGKLSVAVFPAATLSGFRQDKGSLEAYVSSILHENKAQNTAIEVQGYSDASAVTENAASQPSSSGNAAVDENALSLLVQALAADDKSGAGGLNSAGVAALVAALSRQGQGKRGGTTIKASDNTIGDSNPAMLSALLQSHLHSLEPTASAVPNSQTVASTCVGGGPGASPMQAAGGPAIGSPIGKLLCRLELMDLFAFHPEFDVAALIVGAEGSNIQFVLNEAKNKVDIDLDGIPVNEAPVAERLHLTVTALDPEAYTIAVESLEDLLKSICYRYAEFLAEKNSLPVPPTVGFRRHEYKEGDKGQLIYLGQTESPKTWYCNRVVSSAPSAMMRNHL